MYQNCTVLFTGEEQDPLNELLQELNFQVTSFGHCTKTANSIEKTVTLPDYEFIYIVEGSITFGAEGARHRCPQNGMILLEPFVSYSIFEMSDEISYFYMHFEVGPAYRIPQFHELLQCSTQPVFQSEEIAHLTIMFTQLEKETRGRSCGYQALLILGFLRVMAYLFRAHAPASGQIVLPTLTSRETQIVSDSIAYIEQNLASPLKITDISSHLGISENYLYKSFMNVLGISPSKYLLRYKVKRAERLLRTGSHTVEQISRMLGFSSLFHFSKTFKDYFGASPKQYLKNRTLE